MIQNLKTKGFTYDAKSDELSGKFNGKDAIIYISTNYGKVDRVYVGLYGLTESKSQIIITFNNLIKQFENNSKYLALIPNDPIPNEEDIYYEMTIHNKRYEAAFDLIPQDTVAFQQRLQSIYSEKYPDDLLAKLTEKEKEEATREMLLIAFDEWDKIITGRVWFILLHNYGKYYIGIYYDNLKNRPNGEDL